MFKCTFNSFCFVFEVAHLPVPSFLRISIFFSSSFQTLRKPQYFICPISISSLRLESLSDSLLFLQAHLILSFLKPQKTSASTGFLFSFSSPPALQNVVQLATDGTATFSRSTRQSTTSKSRSQSQPRSATRCFIRWPRTWLSASCSCSPPIRTTRLQSRRSAIQSCSPRIQPCSPPTRLQSCPPRTSQSIR